ncbi:hypothetical protein [Dyella psychrodurans]|uniref:hypothetical protein n=1 Tax=Dyella psychrodurans TaxID=1927960 RepID=UPI0018F57805|nr:hypothetical protein [Dyella psychrodurans]
MKFEDRAVAFIDVLGFKTLVAGAVERDEQLKQLSGLVDLLSSAVPTLDASVDTSIAAHLIPKHIYISDCIILSAPLTDTDRQSYDGLSVVVMRAIQLAHYFLRAGHLIRGGISVGKVWHTNSNIVGPAYQEAFLLEQNCNEPIIVLSESAAKRWNGGSRMCLQDNGQVFVNGLFDYYIPNNTQHGEIERTYANYAALADQKLAEGLPQSAHEKWSWFKTFLQTEASEGLKWAQA